MVRVYMAGPIQHVNDYGKGWRNRLKKSHPEIDWVDPLDKYNTMEEAETEWTAEQVVEDDLDMIDSCDAILVHWQETPTCGTPMEIFYTHTEGKSVIVQTTVEDPSPWLTYHATALVETFDAAVKMLKMVEGYQRKA